MSAETPVVELVGAGKRYPQVEALRPLDLRIEPGEVVAVLGPNGAGKTTAIKLMLGLRAPTAGRALLFGLDPSDRRARIRSGVMLQESGVPGSLTVREIVRLFGSHYPSPLPTERVLELARLDRKPNARASTLSGGERQRLYYAVAICGDPEALFLDEPTVGLDVESRNALIEDVAAFAAAGKAIVLTTHYLDEADRLARRVVVIDRGRIIADAPPERIKAAVPGRRIRFKSDRALTAGDFQGLPVEALHIEDHSARMLSDDPAGVVSSLVAAGVAMRELEVTGADLEEAFLVLTGSQGRG